MEQFEEELKRLAKIKVFINSRPRHKPAGIDGILNAINQNRISIEQKIDQQNQMFRDNIQRVEASLNELRNLVLDQKQSTADSRASILKNHVTGSYSLVQNFGQTSKTLLDSTRQMEIYESKTAEQDLLTHQVKSAVAKVLPEIMGLYTNHEAENCVIETLDESENDLIFLQALKHLQCEFPQKISGPSRNLFHLVRTLVENYNNKLSPRQIKSLIISCCSPEFKDLIYRFFPANINVNEALQTIVSIYGKTPRTSKLFSKLYNIRFNWKKPESSLKAVFNQIALCYPDADLEKLTEMSIQHSMAILPGQITQAVIPKILSIKKLLSSQTQNMTYHHFLEIINEYLGTIKTPKIVLTEYTETESENFGEQEYLANA